MSVDCQVSVSLFADVTKCVCGRWFVMNLKMLTRFGFGSQMSGSAKSTRLAKWMKSELPVYLLQHLL